MPSTETISKQFSELDLYPDQQLIAALIEDQATAAAAVAASQAALVAAVNAALPRINAGGRLIYVGAGSSGRLGVLDGVELSPTFSWPTSRAIGVMAGGRDAMFVAVEGAEDDAAEGTRQLQQLQLTANDVVLLLAASGSTPFVLGALQAAHLAGALTLGFANNRDSALLAQAEIAILLDTGAEILAGSTRLKAGTAQKIALNTLSTALMIRLNKVYGNLMVDVKPANAKLRQRCLNLVLQLCGCTTEHARDLLQQADFQVKTATVMYHKHLDACAARALLQEHGGSLRAVLRT